MGGRILIVEDDATAREALTELLTDEGYDVRAAGHSEAAINIGTTWNPQVVVVDYNLPDGTGIQVADKVRETHRLCAVIVMTGTAELVTDDDGVRFNDREAESRAAGAIAYLPKPIDFDELLKQLKRCLSE